MNSTLTWAQVAQNVSSQPINNTLVAAPVPTPVVAGPPNPIQTIPPAWLENGTVLCCIDLENHCRNQPRTYEIGIAFADGRTLSWSNRGDRWRNAFTSIERSARDFGIIENKHKVKKSHGYWCRRGVPEDFLYGKPKYIRQHTVRDEVVRCIRKVLGDLNRPPTAAGYTNDTPVEFVFFDKTNDLIWLNNLGVNLTQEFPNSTITDLQRSDLCLDISQNLNKQQCSAEDFLGHLGVDHTGAHNGGNDAVHELQSYLAMDTLTDEQRAHIRAGGSLPMIERG